MTPEDGDVIVIVPVALAQVGCVTFTIGVDGFAFTVSVTNAVLKHPVELFKTLE